MVYCQQCGRLYSNGANFCTICGSRLPNNGPRREQTVSFSPSSSIGDAIVPSAANGGEAAVLSECVKLSNPINYATVKMAIAISLSTFVIGNIWIYAEYGFDWFAMVLSTVIAMAIFIGIAGTREINWRPREVEITESGVILSQKLKRKSIFVPWAGIQWVGHNFIKPEERNWANRDSHLGVSEKKFYVLNWDVEEAVLDGYRTKMGRYPPNKRDNR